MSNELAAAIADELRKWWSFDNHQNHTHSWHCREDFIQKELPRLTTQHADEVAELREQLAEEKYHTEVVETIMKAANQVIAELEAENKRLRERVRRIDELGVVGLSRFFDEDGMVTVGWADTKEEFIRIGGNYQQNRDIADAIVAAFTQENRDAE